MSNSESLSEVHGSVDPNAKKGWRRIFAFLGPAYLISVGYMDPGNWATDIAGGSQFGYKLIWVLLMSNLIALLLQSLSARLGIVKGLDLAQASKKAYPKWVNLPLYILAQIAIIACDLAEIIGMAIGLNLLFGIPLIWGISITVLDTILLLFLLKKGMRSMEAFILSMVFIVGLSFLFEMFIVEPNFKDIAKGFIPSELNGSALYIAIGIIGATVMPHNLYLHSSLVQTRKIERTDHGIKEAIKFNFIDTAVALNLAFFVNAAILILAAAAFYTNGHHEVAEIQDAYKLLENIFGTAAPTLFAIALIASGQSSTVTGTLAGQIVMEGHLNLRIEPWVRRLLTRMLAIAPAFFTILHYGEDSLGGLLILSQVVLSLQLAFAIIPLIYFTSSKREMGKFVIKTWVKVLAWIAAITIIILNIKLVIDEIGQWIVEAGSDSIWIYVFVIPIAIALGLLLLYIILAPLLSNKDKKHRSILPHGKALNFQDLAIPEYKNIGVSIDFSEHDKTVIRHALMQGGKTAKYTLIHIVETAGATYHQQNVLDMETISDEDNLKKYAERLESMGYEVQYTIGYGSTASAIAKIVNGSRIDFLVMGAHGHKGFKDLIFGSTINTVRHNVKVPVLVVRD
ncbi:Mn2+/Fe2+ transporter, NRAMP family [Pseudopedobacter saltans DSM 12145]|uniref:Divalent metal cation transporter MntH n=1 Tax=Pseudopedobacter saltans (strain ATCC 51119 / DSM 12145 / JCM 21818 / CCUG 39354 / LMG 10337 / NBRC 100064 / NCIMB 13643) TaxID=762903 RepID=F0S9X9_PSESL|nr:Nramp family divalent metal transporter [Pseudopedobacter saltans]ADY52537.1 Mn2+/Fe2+ transporter, NRAMP family [Pseudopedobacter saltans DSM 12145]